MGGGSSGRGHLSRPRMLTVGRDMTDLVSLTVIFLFPTLVSERNGALLIYVMYVCMSVGFWHSTAITDF